MEPDSIHPPSCLLVAIEIRQCCLYIDVDNRSVILFSISVLRQNQILCKYLEIVQLYWYTVKGWTVLFYSDNTKI